MQLFKIAEIDVNHDLVDKELYLADAVMNNTIFADINHKYNHQPEVYSI